MPKDQLTIDFLIYDSEKRTERCIFTLYSELWGDRLGN